jgi:hypothetical protein
MRSAIFAFALLTSSLCAQANNFAGLRCFVGAVGSPPTLTCGLAFSCNPTTLNTTAGSTVSAVTLGAPLNGLYAIAASFDIAGLGCIQLPIPGLVNSVILNPGSMVTLVAGAASVSDGGRCNGGTPGALVLFTIPTSFPSAAVAVQAVQATPLSGGGNGLALSNAVIVSW